MGHVGLTPQTATVLGGFKAQGRTAERARQLVDEALALEEAGCFAVVLEAVPAQVARAITQALDGADDRHRRRRRTCDGQVLVWHDMLGYYEGHAPRFVKRYADLGARSSDALGRYAEEVRSGAFPEAQHTYAMPEEELRRVRRGQRIDAATMSAGTTAAIATAPSARASVQPWTARTPTTRRQTLHASDGVVDAAEDRVPAPVVVPPVRNRSTP